ncbi:MAG: hypothetical protein ABH872_00660 [Candidatus Omnitrophota bacterium]
MKIIRIIHYFFTVFLFIAICLNVFAQAELQERLKLLPRGTELVFEKQDGEKGVVEIIKRKYYSQAQKNEILEFYRIMFINEGFKELEGYPPIKDEKLKLVYSFSKGQTMVMLNFLQNSERLETTYWLSTHYVKSIPKGPLENKEGGE